MTLGAEPAATDARLARKRMFPKEKPSKIYASESPARQAPMIHGIQLWLSSDHSCVHFCGFASFGGADVPSLSGALTDGCYDSLAACRCSSSLFCAAFRASAPARPAATFLDPSLSSPLPYQKDYVPAPRALLRLLNFHH